MLSMNEREYSQRLVRLGTAWWKTLFNVQAPYRWNLRRLKPGFTLDIGCGIGRNLLHIDGAGVGTDASRHSVDICRERGLTAFVPDEFARSEYARPGRFDSILLSHVAEHMTLAQLTALLREHLPYLRPDGRILLIAPQEAGYRSDPTHVEFMDFDKLTTALSALDFERERAFSFPFPRWAGQLFTYNEFVVVGRPRTRPRHTGGSPAPAR